MLHIFFEVIINLFCETEQTLKQILYCKTIWSQLLDFSVIWETWQIVFLVKKFRTYKVFTFYTKKLCLHTLNVQMSLHCLM